MYIYQRSGWPDFEWNNDSLLPLLSAVRHRQGRLLGQMENLGFSLRSEAILQTLTLDVLKSNEIEGDMLDKEQVRSSIARRLGIETGGLIPSGRQVDGVVEVLLDATQNYERQITTERLFGWHAAMFPGGHSGLHKITVGEWRNGAAGPMQVVSGPMGKETVHFEAPDAPVVGREMQYFISWFNATDHIDPVLKAGIAHFWFVTVHPFDDGNGRIARCIADMQLARADSTAQRFYSMSVQIRKEQAKYYHILEKTQKGGLDITDWLAWFLSCLGRALTTSEESLSAILRKARFWEYLRQKEINTRQQIMLNKLLDGFDGKLTTTKWAKITKSSQDTALRDIQLLIEQDILIKEASGGRSTSYVLKDI
jgi:Fic family protein